jgi:(p)ppGpp synthase/HD superfamily hydrolase
MTLYEQALKIAATAHKDQKRKHDGSPYIVHPIMVARILEQHGFSEVVVAAGLVHDVIEDSNTSEAELRSALGDEVVDIVVAVSEDQSTDWRSMEGGWEKVKEMYVDTVCQAPVEVKAVSVADKIHNAQNLLAHANLVGSEIWTNFNRGKNKKIWFEELLCEGLSKQWQHPMLDVYHDLIEEMKKVPD